MGAFFASPCDIWGKIIFLRGSFALCPCGDLTLVWREGGRREDKEKEHSLFLSECISVRQVRFIRKIVRLSKRHGKRRSKTSTLFSAFNAVFPPVDFSQECKIANIC